MEITFHAENLLHHWKVIRLDMFLVFSVFILPVQVMSAALMAMSFKHQTHYTAYLNAIFSRLIYLFPISLTQK